MPSISISTRSPGFRYRARSPRSNSQPPGIGPPPQTSPAEVAELITGDDARPKGVRPIFSGGRAHSDFSCGHLDIPGGEVIEDRDAEEVARSLRGVDLAAALPEDETDFGLVVHLRREDQPRALPVERLEAHR